MQSKLLISDKLRDILVKMENASVIARQLLDLADDITKHSIHEDHPDYLCQSNDEPTNLSYLTPERIQSLKTQLADFNTDVWTTKRRFRSRPAALVQKILTNVSGRDVEIFSNVFKSIVRLTKFSFSVVDGEDIARWYHHSKQADCAGSLGMSCMKHDFCQDYFDIYTQHPDVVKMLIMTDERGKLLGRSLLWQSPTAKVMDRIYTINDEELPYHFKTWAVENGFVYKTHQKWNDSLHFIKEGISVAERFSFTLPGYRHVTSRKFPYMDTFKFFDSTKGIVANYLIDGCDMLLMSPEGKSLPADSLVEDYFENIYYHRHEMVSISYLTDSPVYVRSENCRHSDSLDTYILRRDAFYSQVIDDYIFSKELSHLNDIDRIKNVIKGRCLSDFDYLLSVLKKKEGTTKSDDEVDKLYKQFRKDTRSGNYSWIDEIAAEWVDSIEDLYEEVKKESITEKLKSASEMLFGSSVQRDFLRMFRETITYQESTAAEIMENPTITAIMTSLPQDNPDYTSLF